MAGRRLFKVWIALQILVGLAVLIVVAEPRTRKSIPSATATDPVTPPDGVEALHPLVPRAPTTLTSARPEFPVSGRVVTHDGRPVADAKVVLSLDGGLLGGFAAVLTDCPAPEVCYRGRETRTDGSGRFQLSVTEGAGRKESIIAVRPGTEDGPMSTLQLTLSGRAQDVGTISLWEPKFVVNFRDASWSPAPPNGASGALLLGDSEKNGLSLKGDTSGVRYDARLFEDFHLGVRVIGVNGGSVVISQLVTVRGPGPPASRSRPCVVSEPSPPTVRSDCPWTAGKIQLTTTHVDANVLDIDLASERPVNYLGLRGSTNVKEVQISADRANWQPVQVTTDFSVEQYAGYFLTAPAAARWVRIRWATFGVSGLDGLSLWT